MLSLIFLYYIKNTYMANAIYMANLIMMNANCTQEVTNKNVRQVQLT